MAERETMDLEKMNMGVDKLLPRLDDWELIFKPKYDLSLEDRERLLINFTNFMNNDEAESLFVPSVKCYLSGAVEGRSGIEDGMVIITSYILEIEKVGMGYALDKRHDLFCATTATGSTYYFYGASCSPSMEVVFDFIKRKGRVLKHHLKFLTFLYQRKLG